MVKYFDDDGAVFFTKLWITVEIGMGIFFIFPFAIPNAKDCFAPPLCRLLIMIYCDAFLMSVKQKNDLNGCEYLRQLPTVIRHFFGREPESQFSLQPICDKA